MEEEEECQCEEGAPAWMATFSDMATLMLCFFVLLLSFANMDVENFRTALGSVREAFGVQFKVNGRFESLSDSPISLSEVQSTDVLHRERPIEKEAINLVREFLADKGLSGSVEVDSGARGIILRTKDQVLFDPGAAQLKRHGTPVLDAMRELADSFDGELAVEGHTDDRPIKNAVFPSNWELSGARSAAVLRYLLEASIDPALVHVAGYADMRPVASNATPDGRAQNRRVEFVFEYDKAAYANPADAFKMPKYRKLAQEKQTEAEKLAEQAAKLAAEAEAAQRKAAEAREQAADAKREMRRIRGRRGR